QLPAGGAVQQQEGGRPAGGAAGIRGSAGGKHGRRGVQQMPPGAVKPGAAVQDPRQSSAHVKGMSPNQLKELSELSMEVAVQQRAEDMEKRQAAIQGKTPGQIAAMGQKAIANLIDEEIRVLNPDQIKAFMPEQVSLFTKDQLSSFIGMDLSINKDLHRRFLFAEKEKRLDQHIGQNAQQHEMPGDILKRLKGQLMAQMGSLVISEKLDPDLEKIAKKYPSMSSDSLQISRHEQRLEKQTDALFELAGTMWKKVSEDVQAKGGSEQNAIDILDDVMKSMRWNFNLKNIKASEKRIDAGCPLLKSCSPRD